MEPLRRGVFSLCRDKTKEARRTACFVATACPTVTARQKEENHTPPVNHRQSSPRQNKQTPRRPWQRTMPLPLEGVPKGRGRLPRPTTHHPERTKPHSAPRPTNRHHAELFPNRLEILQNKPLQPPLHRFNTMQNILIRNPENLDSQ